MAKDMGSVARTSAMGSNAKKNKLSKKRRDALKKKVQEQVTTNSYIQNSQEIPPQQGKYNVDPQCQQFVMEDDRIGLDIPPLQIQYNPSSQINLLISPPLHVPSIPTLILLQILINMGS